MTEASIDERDVGRLPTEQGRNRLHPHTNAREVAQPVRIGLRSVAK
jgi:hypothetical protein